MLLTLKSIFHFFSFFFGILLGKIILLSLKVCKICLRGDLVLSRIRIGLESELY